MPGSTEHPHGLLPLPVANAASPCPFLAPSLDPQPPSTPFFLPKGSRWGAFPTADLQGLFLGGETTHWLLRWLDSSLLGPRVGRAREWSMGEGGLWDAALSPTLRGQPEGHNRIH